MCSRHDQKGSISNVYNKLANHRKTKGERSRNNAWSTLLSWHWKLKSNHLKMKIHHHWKRQMFRCIFNLHRQVWCQCRSILRHTFEPMTFDVIEAKHGATWLKAVCLNVRNEIWESGKMQNSVSVCSANKRMIHMHFKALFKLNLCPFRKQETQFS